MTSFIMLIKRIFQKENCVGYEDERRGVGLVSIERYSIVEARTGMKLGRVVLSNTGTILLDKNVILTDVLIAKLKKWGILEIFAEKEDVFDVLAKERRHFIAKRDKWIITVEGVFNSIELLETLNVGTLQKLIDEMLMPVLLQSDSIFSYLHVMHYKGEDLFRHSVNVAVIAGLMGKWMHLSEAEIKQLVLVGLLHDIGKTRIPEMILNKPGKLLPEEMKIMKQHAFIGYEILQTVDAIDEITRQGVLQHHERLDGSGYPGALLVDQVGAIAKIIAIADAYDAIVSPRVYHKASSPIEAMRWLYHEMFGRMDPQICLLFIQQAKKSLIGSLVKLSNGVIAKIIYLQAESVSAPIVQMMSGEYLSLEEMSDVDIVEFIY